MLPTLGSKELVVWLPTLLGLGAGDEVVHPERAYPSYDVGARLAGATPVPADSLFQLGPRVARDGLERAARGAVRLIWLNSPGNPTGKVLGVDHLAKVVRWARSVGAVVASDECYAELGWDVAWAHESVPSVLDPRVTDGDRRGILSVYSLSKQSNLAGYRAAFLAGDRDLIARLTTARKHLGLMLPAPVQAAMTAALGDDDHVAEQRSRYRARRDVLKPALEAAGFRIDHSEGGLYLWASEGRDAWATMARLAELGILAGPGHFYGEHFPQHVRFSLTATDERIAAAAARLRASTETS